MENGLRKKCIGMGWWPRFIFLALGISLYVLAPVRTPAFADSDNGFSSCTCNRPNSDVCFETNNGGLQACYTGDRSSSNYTGGILTFSSSNPAVKSLQQAWRKQHGNLSYALQEKITVSNNHSDFFMMGLSFRVDQPDTVNPNPPAPSSFYGVSFFRKNDGGGDGQRDNGQGQNGNDQCFFCHGDDNQGDNGQGNEDNGNQTPYWWTHLKDNSGVNEFDSLQNNKLYLVFWEYLGRNKTDNAGRTCGITNGCYYLLDYSPLSSVVTSGDDGDDGDDSANLLAGSTLVVNVQDTVSGGVHTNNISAYIAQSQNQKDAYYYPVVTSTGAPVNSEWPPSNRFYPVSTWYAYTGKTNPPSVSQPLADDSLTPGKYYKSSTSEIGVHAFYDVNGQNGNCSGGEDDEGNGCKDLFTDFGMKMDRGSTSGGGALQYY